VKVTENPTPEASPLLLDTGAILGGLSLPPTGCLTTPSVLAEIREGGPTGRRAEALVAAGIEVRAPDAPDVERVRTTATRSGALSRLSTADIDILALALGSKGRLLSDDHTVLDIAQRLGIAAQPATTRGIAATKDWASRCRGCGRRGPAEDAGQTCRVCGAEIRLVPRPTR
jgi:endoribonuclease Nob1